jgi:hypothetical protein
MSKNFFVKYFFSNFETVFQRILKKNMPTMILIPKFTKVTTCVVLCTTLCFTSKSTAQLSTKEPVTSADAELARFSTFYISPASHHFLENDPNRESLWRDLNHLFLTKNYDIKNNTFWEEEDMRKYNLWAYGDIFNVEKSNRKGKSQHFLPTIQFIEKVKSEPLTYRLKLSFMGQEENGFASLRMIYNILAVKKGTEFRFKRAMSEETLDWATNTTGYTRFFYNCKHGFDSDGGIKTEQLNQIMAKKFNVQPDSLQFFVCSNPAEMYRLRGFDYCNEMYEKTLDGHCEPAWSAIYSVNNSEGYPRAVAQNYLGKLYGEKIHDVFYEGYASVIGGSQGFPLEWHLHEIKLFMEKNPEKDLVKMMFAGDRIGEKTNMMYHLGGLICQLTETRKGIDGLRILFTAGKSDDDFFNAIEQIFNFKRDVLNEYLKLELRNF